MVDATQANEEGGLGAWRTDRVVQINSALSLPISSIRREPTCHRPNLVQ